MTEAKAGAAATPGEDQDKRAAPKPPVEVVLPLPYYLILLAELGGLIALHFTMPEDSGGALYSKYLGWAGTLSMVIMHVYSIRRRVRSLSTWGPLRSWLHFHIFMGLQGGLLVTYHAWNLHTLWNLSGINILMTLIVVASGLFGRYLFSFIPKGFSGERLSAKQIEDELAGLVADVKGKAPTPELAEAVASFSEGAKITGRVGFFRLIREDLRSRKALVQLQAALRRSITKRIDGSFDTILKLEAFADAARRRVLLSRRLATFVAADSFFRNWTILHKPLTFLLLGATLLHIFAHYLYRSAYSG